MSLETFLLDNGHIEFEGHVQEIPQQVEDILVHVRKFFKKDILEIGFNAGHSAEIFLNEYYSKVTSFDIGCHHYVSCGKEYLDKTFPGNHTLVIGNSVETIPLFETDQKFDIIFIDGSTEYETIKADLANCKRFAHENTIVMLDDTMFTEEWSLEWNRGPTQAWLDAIADGLVIEISHADYTMGRGMAVGKYIL